MEKINGKRYMPLDEYREMQALQQQRGAARPAQYSDNDIPFA